MIFFYFHIKNKRKGYFFEVRFYLLNQEKTITYFWRKILSLESRGSASRVGRVSRKGKAATCRNFSSRKGRKETKRKIHVFGLIHQVTCTAECRGTKRKKRILSEEYMWKDSVQIAKPLTSDHGKIYCGFDTSPKDNKSPENTAKRYQNL